MTYLFRIQWEQWVLISCLSGQRTSFKLSDCEGQDLKTNTWHKWQVNWLLIINFICNLGGIYS